MPHAEVHGQRIHYTDSGGEGPAVLLAHGFLMDHEMFSPQVAALADEFRVITWDARGFGETEFDGKPFDYWDNAEWRDRIGTSSNPADTRPPAMVPAIRLRVRT